ncbi:MAG: HAD hydrolase-like protein [Microgenomates group bacterium]|jgi:FMN phosphatase YigB (HAD superfamily)|nr:HAD hydrolase-like protein [Candidatus Woesebacteria bacterium]QQR63503.1 MAG: HAD hydrolase-like protein [Candidatus Roizmanbacteria bacterium]
MQRIIFDWKRTLYDPDSQKLCEGAVELLKYLSLQKIDLVLVGKGQPNTIQDVIRLGLSQYFSKIFFVGTLKSKDIFSPFITNPPLDTYVVGDRIRSEIILGKELGTTTVWIRLGKFADEVPQTPEEEPSLTFSSLSDFLVHLRNS